MKTGVIFRLTTEIPQTGFRKFSGGGLLFTLHATVYIGILYSSDFILENQSGIMRLIQAKGAFDGQHLGES